MGSGPAKVLVKPVMVKLPKEVIDWVNSYYDADTLAKFNAKALMQRHGAYAKEAPFGIKLMAVLFALNDKEVGKQV